MLGYSFFIYSHEKPENSCTTLACLIQYSVYGVSPNPERNQLLLTICGLKGHETVLIHLNPTYCITKYPCPTSFIEPLSHWPPYRRVLLRVASAHLTFIFRLSVMNAAAA